MPLLDALKARKTSRAFLPKPLPRQVLSDLLWAAAGISRPETGKRTAPSARNWQEIDVYVTVRAAYMLGGGYAVSRSGVHLDLDSIPTRRASDLALVAMSADDPDLLVEVACGDDSPRVRLTAVSRVSDDINLEKLPILKCWPDDAGRFITLPCVVTRDPDTGERGAEPLRTLMGYRRRDSKVYFGQNLIQDGLGRLAIGMPVEVIE